MTKKIDTYRKGASNDLGPKVLRTNMRHQMTFDKTPLDGRCGPNDLNVTESVIYRETPCIEWPLVKSRYRQTLCAEEHLVKKCHRQIRCSDWLLFKEHYGWTLSVEGPRGIKGPCWINDVDAIDRCNIASNNSARKVFHKDASLQLVLHSLF